MTLHRADQLPDWFLCDEIKSNSTWAVRESADEAPALRVACGTEENMRLAAAAVKMAKLLATIHRSPNFDAVYFKRRIVEVLAEAGVTP